MLRYRLPWLVAALFTIASAVRLIYLGDIPANVNPDACDTLVTYLRFKQNGLSHIFSLNWNGAPALNAYLIGWSWELFGQSVFGLRFMSALIGALTVVMAFLLFYILTGSLVVAFFSGLSFSVNPWVLNFSRDGWENIFGAFFLLMLAFGILQRFYFNSSKRYALLFIVLGASFGFYCYHPGKFFIVAAMLPFLLESARQRSFRILTEGLLVLAVFLIVAAPHLLVLGREHLRAFHRIRAVSIYSTENPLEAFKENVLRNFRGFILWAPYSFGDNRSIVLEPRPMAQAQRPRLVNVRYLPVDRGIVNRLLLPFFMIGLVVAAFRYSYLVLLLLFTLAPPELFSTFSPDAARGIHAAGVLYAFIPYGMTVLASLSTSRVHRVVVHVIFVVVLLTAAVVDFMDYFKWITSPLTLQARRPAVLVADFRRWGESVKAKVARGEVNITVDAWERAILEEQEKSPHSPHVLFSNTARKP